MNRAGCLQRVAALVDQLVETSVHYEAVYSRDEHRNKRLTGSHRVTVPGLLAQLEEEFARRVADGPYVSATLYGPRPPVALDCLSTHTQVTIAVARWLWDHQEPQRETVQGNLRAMVGLAGRLPDADVERLVDDLARWVRWCQVLTGWASPAWRPHGASCPVDGCRGRGTLRVHLSAQTAICLGCGTTWGPDDIADLAHHVRCATEADPVAA